MEAGPEPKIQAVPRDAPEKQGGLKLAQGLLLRTEVQIKFQLWKKISLPLDKSTLVLSNSNALRAYLRSKIIFTFMHMIWHASLSHKITGDKTSTGLLFQPRLCETLKYLSMLYLLVWLYIVGYDLCNVSVRKLILSTKICFPKVCQKFFVVKTDEFIYILQRP